MFRTRLWVLFFAVVAILGGCKNIVQGLQEQVYVYVSGQVAAALTQDATIAIEERLLESLSGVDAEYQGDGKWILVPVEGQPPLGANTTDATRGGSITLSSFRAMTTAATSKTGYTLTQGAGPDGFFGWYETHANGFVYYYKTIPVSDLSQGWPGSVQTLYSGWKAEANAATYRGYSWWMKNTVLTSTHVKGEWHFDVAADAPSYGGTSYKGTYDYENESGVKAVVAVTGAMKLQYAGNTREAYTNYAYAFTNQTNLETGRYYYGVGPERAFAERPDWAQSVNPAGADWTDKNGRPGLSYFKVWVDKAYSWWRYDGTSQSCSSEASNIALSGAGVVTAGRTLQITATATNNCHDVLRYRTFEWTSSTPDVATVNASGLVTALKAGETAVQAKSGTASATVNITVRELDTVPSYITIGGGSNVQVGSTFTLSATVYNKNNEALDGAPIEWSAGNGKASVSTTGVVTGLQAGSVNITAKSGTVTAVRAVQVYDPSVVTSVYTYCNRSNVVVSSNTAQCSATLYNYAGAAINGSVTWTSSNGAVLTVDSAGLVTPVASGSALVRATSANGQYAQYNMAVYSQNDISYIVIGSANGSSLRIGDSAFKLSLEAKAYNFNSDEIQGLNFSWSIYDYPSRASVVAQSPTSLAQVSVGSQEGYVTIRAQAGSTVGSFQAGAWDNRISYINITNEPAFTVAQNSTRQLYVQAFNANSRSLGYVTPAWSSTGSMSISPEGLLTASGVGNGSVTATVPKGDGSGDATDTSNFTVIDPALVTTVSASCGVSTIYTGNSFSCYAYAYNGLGLTVSGAPVTWTTTNAALVDGTGSDNSVSPNRGDFQAPAGILNGGAAQLKAYVGAVGSGLVTINAKGSADINYISVTNPGASSFPIGTMLGLTATAYDFQPTPQAIPGVTFTWSKSGNGYTNPATAAGTVWAVSTYGGSPTYFYATTGSVTSGALALYATDPGQAYYVNVYRSNSAQANLNIGDTFTVWAKALQNNGTTEIPGTAFTFSATSRIQLTPIGVDGTSATATVVRCDCSSSTTNTYIQASASGPGWSQSGTNYFNINNPIWNVWISEAQNQNLSEGSSYPLTVTFSGANNGPVTTAVNTTFYDQGYGDFDVDSSGVISVLTFNNLTNSYAVRITPLQTATGSQGATTYWSFKIVPPMIDMTAAVNSSSAPLLNNGTLLKSYYFFSPADYALALTYDTLTTTSTSAENTWSKIFYEALDQYDSGYYGVRVLSTGNVDATQVGVRFEGYIRFSTLSTAYLQLGGFDRSRITIGGIVVLDQWSHVGSPTRKSVGLTNLVPGNWYPVSAEGLLSTGMSYSNLINATWSSGGTFISDPTSVGFSLGRDP